MPLIPQGHIVVSESGIKNRNDILRLREWGVDAVLIGETLVKAEDVAAKLGELMSDKS
jgi:indole-3-glycerol phosphate synthase